MDRSEIELALATERQVTLERINALTGEFEGIVDGALDANGDDEHDPEGSTIAYERAKVSTLLVEARGYLAEVELAASNLASGSYGTCGRCGEAISPERLAARPATRTCITCAAYADVALGAGAGADGAGATRSLWLPWRSSDC